MASNQTAKTAAEHEAEVIARSDPSERHADGAAWGTQLKNRDPKKKYVLVHMSNVEMGPEFYEELGYSKEVYAGERGVRMAAGKTVKPGEFITFRGSVLMSISKAEADKIRLEGAPGAGHGQLAWDKLEKRIVAKNRSSLLAGIPGASQTMGVVNRTSSEERVGSL